ncbi:hypothetical protein Gorai_010832 [Gossypium raimondii]|nr:hypothetical protein [Gossypium raimondii]
MLPSSRRTTCSQRQGMEYGTTELPVDGNTW